MMRYLLILVVILIACNQNDTINSNKVLEIKETIKKDSISYHFLDSLEYSGVNNLLKWKIYLKYCDEKIVRDENREYLLKQHYFGETDFYLFMTSLKKDSLLSIYYSFYLNDSIEVLKNNYQFEDSSMAYNFINHIYYNVNSKNIYGYGKNRFIELDISGKKIADYCNGVPNCDEEKKKFIIKNRNKLNKWFVEEAIKRGFIEKKWWWFRWYT